jgi:hypothetical protein
MLPFAHLVNRQASSDVCRPQVFYLQFLDTTSDASFHMLVAATCHIDFVLVLCFERALAQTCFTAIRSHETSHFCVTSHIVFGFPQPAVNSTCSILCAEMSLHHGMSNEMLHYAGYDSIFSLRDLKHHIISINYSYL